ncbi:MAG: GyrI-like domain-containing protein [Burkholderiales bacterium]
MRIMSQPIPDRPSDKLLMFALIVFVLAIAGAGGIALFLGAFNQPVLHQIRTPEYRLIYLEHVGPYNEAKDVFKHVENALKKGEITPIAPATLFLDDPAKVAPDKLRSKVGYLIHDGNEVPAGFAEETLASREIIQATFNGSPIIGSYKTYAAMKRWSADNHYQLILPSLEIYYADGHVEYQLPIQRNP